MMQFIYRYGIVAVLLIGMASGYAWAATQLGTIGNFQPQYLTQTTTSCTVSASSSGCAGLSTGDCGTFIDVTNSGAVTITLPNNVSVPSCGVTFQQDGAGLVTLATASGATLNSSHSFTKSAGQNAIFGARVKTTGSSTVWTFFGDGQ